MANPTIMSLWTLDRAETSTTEIAIWEAKMAKNKDKEAGVYRIVDVIGVSAVSWEEAAKRAVETAAKSLRDMRIAEVIKMDLKVEDGKVVAYRTKLALSFKYEK
jgi:dodecin